MSRLDTLRDDMKTELSNMRYFARDCAESEHTDTGEAWLRLERMRSLLRRAVKALPSPVAKEEPCRS